jgi:adenylate cyclase
VTDEIGPETELDAFTELILPHRRAMTLSEVAEESGVEPGLVTRLRRAMGLPDVADDEAAFTEQDCEALRLAATMIADKRMTEAEVLRITRTLGLNLARMADAIVGFWADRANELREAGDEVQPDRLGGVEHIGELEAVVGILLRRHMLDNVGRRIGAAMSPVAGHEVAVGFADLVGFTSLSEQLSDTETAELVERFEDLATDTVVSGGGRVIKMIGDEVMFRADPSDVGAISLSLAEAFASPDLPSVRVGVASGHVVAYSGDLFGPVVNLAARATMAAFPGTVLISPALAEHLKGDERFFVKPIRPRRLKGIGVVELYSLRRSTRRAE